MTDSQRLLRAEADLVAAKECGDEIWIEAAEKELIAMRTIVATCCEECGEEEHDTDHCPHLQAMTDYDDRGFGYVMGEDN